MVKNKILKKIITTVFLITYTTEIFANTLILNPNSKHNTKLDKSETGVPIVNISTPNNRGISVNEFLEYNVGKEGQVLNNADNVGRSHLAGLINSNPNLGPHQAANLIVLQVSGSNRSQIEGYLEALSRKKVNVILSNENGIYLDNSGTINIEKFTATTGKVKLKDGDFIGIDVEKGNVAIGPKGLDFTKADYVQILSKTLELTGNLVADKDLKIVAGTNKFDKDGNFEKIETSSPTSVAIDASNLGGMYANTIKIISTDKGAGINSNAFIVSKGNKLEITADGKVKVNKTQGKGIDIKAQNYEQIGFVQSDLDIKVKADNIKLSGAGTQAEQKIILDGSVENHSAIYTKENLYTRDLKNTSDIQALKDIHTNGNLNNSGTILTNSTLTAGNTTNAKKIIAKDNIQTGSLINTDTVATDGSLNVEGKLTNSGNVNAVKEIKVDKDAENTGVILTNSSFSAKDTKITNKLVAIGEITTKNLTNEGELATKGKLKVDGTLANKKNIQAIDSITVSSNVQNDGAILTDSNFSSKNIVNTKTLIARENINSETLDNSGVFSVGENLTVKGSVKNTKIIEAINIDITGDSLINSSNIKADNITATVNNTKNDGEILALNDITLNTKKLDNTKKIGALQNITANNTVLTNSGEIVSNKKIELNDSDITNSNKILSNTIEMKNFTNFNNIGTISGTDVTLTTKKDINLVGNLHGENSLVIEGNNIVNAEKTTGKNLISIKSNDFTNKKELSSKDLRINAGGDILNENVLSAEIVKINANNLTNNDLIAAEKDLTINAKNKVLNTEESTIYAGNKLNIKANEILNESGEILGSNVRLEANHILNHTGTLQALNNMYIKSAKFENIGKVEDLNKYESYYETWDGHIIEAKDIGEWILRYSEASSKRSNGSAGSTIRRRQRRAFENIVKKVENNKYESLLFPKYKKLMEGYLGNSGHHTEKTGSAKIQEIPLKEKVRSLGKTTHAKVLAGDNITIVSDEVLNKDAIISAENTVKIDADKVENLVSVGDEKIKVKTGQESMYIKYERTGKRHKRKVRMEVTYTRNFANDYITKKIPKLDENGKPVYRKRFGRRRPVYETITEYIGRYAYVTGQPSIIEGKEVLIDSTSLVKQDIQEANGYIKKRKDISVEDFAKKNFNTGISNKNQEFKFDSSKLDKIEININTDFINEILNSGKIDTIPNLPSCLFIKNLEPSAKYVMETRIKHISLSNYYGSDYFLNKVGYKEEWDRVKRLGDAFYENQLVERSIIEKLGTRFLNGEAISMKQLIDNAKSEAKNLNLTIGTALTKEQISKLNKDIVWYEYQDVNGLKVLAPKVYLSKNTLANIKADGRSRIEGTELTAIKAKNLDNAGVIGNKGTIYIEADTITNRSIGDQIAEITGDRTTLVAEKDIFNIGSKISATDELNLIAKNGDILNKSTVVETNYDFGDLNRTRHSELENIAEISSGNTLNILADNYTSIAGKTNAKELNIAIKEDVNISSQKLSGEQKFGKDGSNFNSYAFESNIGSNVNAEKINIDAKNLNITGSNLVAEKNININTKEDINIVSNTNSVYTESQSKTKKGFGRASSSTAIDYKETLEKSNILAGNNVNISSNKNILVTGADIYAQNNVNIGAKEDLIIASGLEGNSTVRQTTKTGLFKLSGKAKMEDNLKYTNAEAVIGAEEDVNLNSEKNISIVASELVAGNDINIKAKENVNILAADDKFKSDKKEAKYSVKPFASAKGLKFEAGLKANYSKNKEGNFSTKVKGSEISAQNDINIKSGKDTNIQASTILSENTNIDTKGELNLLTKGEISINNMSGTEIEAKLSARLDLSGIKDTIDSVVDVVKGLPELPKAVNAAVNLASGKDINESLEGNEEGIEEANRILNGPKSGGVSAGIYASGSIEKTKSKTEVKNSIGSNILSKENISLSSEENMKLKQANIQGKNISINSKKDVSIESGISTVNSKASSQSLNGEVNLLTGQFNVGGGISKDKSSEKTHTNTQIYGENIAIKSEDFTVKGGNIEADKVNIGAKNLHIKSMQDEAKAKHQAINISVGSSSVGGGIEYGKHEKEWVEKQSSIIGREKAEINVAEKTNIVGAVIGGADTTLRTKELEFTNIEDKEKGYNIGMNANTNISSTTIFNKADPDNPNKKINISKSGSVNYDAVDREQINRATIGAGTIIVGGKEENSSINRDESKAQEITKDVSADKIGVEYSDNTREWKKVATIMREQGASLGKDIDTITTTLADKNYELENKLGSTFYVTTKGVEEVIDNKLGNKFIAIIPTEDTNGGIAGELQSPSSLLNWNLKPIVITYSGTTDENGKFNIVSNVENLTKEKYEEIKRKNPDDIPYINGVGNTIKDHADGRFIGTLTPEEHEIIKNGGTVQKISILNPTNGLIADVAEAVIGQIGLITGFNWSGKQLHKIEKEYEGILDNGMIAHSQGTIIYTSKLRDDLKTEEGINRLLKTKEHKFLGIAVVPWVLNDTINRIENLNILKRWKEGREIPEAERIKIEKRRNILDFVSIGTLNLNSNTTGRGHEVTGYNPYYFKWNSDILKYDLKPKETGPLPKIKENKVINEGGTY